LKAQPKTRFASPTFFVTLILVSRDTTSNNALKIIQAVLSLIEKTLRKLNEKQELLEQLCQKKPSSSFNPSVIRAVMKESSRQPALQ